MKLVQDKQERMVTISKTQQSLFKKAQELSKLSGCEIAIITFSGAGKAFTFGRYLSITSNSTSLTTDLQVQCQQPPDHLEHVMGVSNQELKEENLFIYQTQMVSSSSSVTTELGDLVSRVLLHRPSFGLYKKMNHISMDPVAFNLQRKDTDVDCHHFTLSHLVQWMKGHYLMLMKDMRLNRVSFSPHKKDMGLEQVSFSLPRRKRIWL